MSREIFDADAQAIADIARQLEEHLKFYREVGITEIGGSQPIAGTSGIEASEALRASSDEATHDSRASQASINRIADAETGESPKPGQAESREAMPLKTGQSDLFDETLSSAAASLPVLESHDPSLQAVRDDLGECTRCKLHERRKRIVFGEGNPQARLMFVGEGPGADEDASGRPFVGRAGQLLDKIIAAIGMAREECYIANVVKCRPPENRTPERDEIATCEPFLFRQIALIKPRVIVTLGLPAFQCLLKTRESMGRARGQWRDWNGVKVMPTFHPAYLLRSPDKKREVWEDMKKVRDYLCSLAD